jgi:Uma2 family endonuclease
MVAIRADIKSLTKLYTVEEYLELEKSSEVRHEYHYGKLIEMPGEAKNANRIARNILLNWNAKLENQGFEIFTHDVKAEVIHRNIYRYPDLVVAPESDDDDKYIIKQPVIMVEVASDGSWKTDTGLKLKEYTALSTLKYYFIVSQEEMFIQMCVRDEDNKRWTFEFFEEENEVINIPAFNLTISLSDIYNKVKFDTEKKVQ